jgi:hypothetical protein
MQISVATYVSDRPNFSSKSTKAPGRPLGKFFCGLRIACGVDLPQTNHGVQPSRFWDGVDWLSPSKAA